MPFLKRTLATLFFGSTGYVFGLEEGVETKGKDEGKRSLKNRSGCFFSEASVASGCHTTVPSPLSK